MNCAECILDLHTPPPGIPWSSSPKTRESVLPGLWFFIVEIDAKHHTASGRHQRCRQRYGYSESLGLNVGDWRWMATTAWIRDCVITP